MDYKRLIRIIGIVGILLLIPLYLTFTGSGIDGIGFHWTLSDFVFAGVLFLLVGLASDYIIRKSPNGWYRAGAFLAVITAFLLIWINAAVGIIGDGDLDSPTALYVVVVLIGIVGTCMARFTARGMMRTLFVVALAQALVPVIALFISDTATWGEPGILGVFILNTCFVTLWLCSAVFFRHAWH